MTNSDYADLMHERAQLLAGWKAQGMPLGEMHRNWLASKTYKKLIRWGEWMDGQPQREARAHAEYERKRRAELEAVALEWKREDERGERKRAMRRKRRQAQLWGRLGAAKRAANALLRAGDWRHP